MKHELRTTPDAETLLLYFTGWGTTPEVVAHLELPEQWDYCAFWDFTEVAPTDLPQLRTDYKQVYLVAWSMGVWAADLLAPHLSTPTKAIAVNGTPLPMHDLYGIPDKIFEGTLAGLDDDNRARFNRRMCGGKKLLAVYNSFSARSTEDLRAELTGVYAQVQGLPGDTLPQLAWSEAIVSERDLIVPQENQHRYWQLCHVPVRTLPHVGHYPFLEYTSWTQLLDV